MSAIMSASRKKSESRRAARRDKAKRIGTKRPTLTRLKKRLWEILSPAVKASWPAVCYTCDCPGYQCGHMFPKGRAHALSAFHPGNLRPQCFSCNINLGGNGAEFARRYVFIEGQEAFDRMRLLSRTPHKWTAPEVEILIEKAKLGLDHYTAFYEARYCEIEGKEAAA